MLKFADFEVSRIVDPDGGEFHDCCKLILGETLYEKGKALCYKNHTLMNEAPRIYVEHKEDPCCIFKFWDAVIRHYGSALPDYTGRIFRRSAYQKELKVCLRVCLGPEYQFIV